MNDCYWRGRQLISVLGYLSFMMEVRSVCAIRAFPGFNTVKSQATTALDTLEYEEMSRQQRKDARNAIKDFVKSMVRGQPLSLVAASGELSPCFCTIDKKVEVLSVCDGSKGMSFKRIHQIPLASICDVLTGSSLPAAEGRSTEDFTVTLWLEAQAAGTSVTFLLANAEERDNFSHGLALLSKQKQAQQSRPAAATKGCYAAARPMGKEGKADRECSVVTDIQLHKSYTPREIPVDAASCKSAVAFQSPAADANAGGHSANTDADASEVGSVLPGSMITENDQSGSRPQLPDKILDTLQKQQEDLMRRPWRLSQE
eukprot:TRINITY_DN26287_c0_g1_i2.p1 TRINITY_DN26287_c0_g1~~TRINITY_DN26287_c0_g1_i2.p1  ORF type:complete len:315 (+),score=62.38 TRINITY_DN26287_c0_g1_i2:47-991(+)